MASGIGAVILAAGLSHRMGRVKSLLPLNGKPLLAWVVESIIDAGGIDPIVVVTGHASEEITRIISAYPVYPVHNPAYASRGMLSSIQTGVAAVAEKAEAFLIALGDQPMVRSRTIAAMCKAWETSRPRLLLPTHGGTHGHPILLSSKGAEEIISLPADATLKTYTSRYETDTMELNVEDDAVLADIDTPEEYEALVQRLNESTGTSGRSASCPNPPRPPRAD